MALTAGQWLRRWFGEERVIGHDDQIGLDDSPTLQDGRMGDTGEGRHGSPAAFGPIHRCVLHDIAGVKRRSSQDTTGGFHPLAAASMESNA